MMAANVSTVSTISTAPHAAAAPTRFQLARPPARAMHAHTICAAAPSSVPMNAVNTTAATSSTPAPGRFDDMEPTCTPDRMPLATTSRHTSETAVRAFGTTRISTEGVELHGGWHNVFNGIAGILNIFVMTGWFGIYVSKKKQDMLWPDMTWVFIISYDIWNFCYTYNCLPTHSWYCGLALLLAPTVAGMLWNKGGWIQNRANTLALWCMFCQVCPLFANDSIFAVQSVNDPNVNLVISLLALGANIAALGYVAYRSKKLGRNPYTNEIFVGTKDYEKAMSREENAA